MVLTGYRSHPAVQRKASYADLVTQYDLASEQLIRRRLAELTPRIAIVGEEQGGELGEQPTWVCDPIDGTVNFAHGHPVFRREHRAACRRGAARSPARWSRPRCSSNGTGSSAAARFRNGSPCSVSATDSLPDALVATGHLARDAPSRAPRRQPGRVRSRDAGSARHSPLRLGGAGFVSGGRWYVRSVLGAPARALGHRRRRSARAGGRREAHEPARRHV